MKIRALVQNQVMLTLIHSGSSHSFVSAQFLDRIGMVPISTSPKQVKVANGDILISDKWVPKLTWWCNGFTLKTSMRVLDLNTSDAILGYDWLKPHSPMHCHWGDKTLEFVDNGRTVCLQGIQPTAAPITELTADQVANWYKGNDIWVVVLLAHCFEESQKEVHPAVQALLHQYQDVFDTPQQLPPARVYDHTIPLIPGVVLVNSRPYRYSPQHKDEIEEQVKEMLKAGLIVPSRSPFASLVLLILKKDGSWRFCVDY